ncbi:hypothetical protein [Streptomyces sp. NPDC005283]|uniref:hypothetical protein n=1 Tax=Streptomyces sp. NPDC005283 TaxID=3156871 RepID=UPI003452C80F
MSKPDPRSVLYAMTLCTELVQLDAVWTAALEDEHSRWDSRRLVEVGRRIIDRLEQLSDHSYAVEAVVPYLSDKATEVTVAAVRSNMSDDLSDQIASLGNVHRLGNFARTAVSQFTDGLADELTVLREKVTYLETGRRPSSDMTPQMVCTVYAMGFTASVALGLAPSALMCAIGFLTNGCVTYLNPDP